MRRSASTFALASLLVHVAPAQDFTHAFDPTGSAVAINSTVTLSLDGSLRGVFDAVANPTGTRTILGVLGAGHQAGFEVRAVAAQRPLREVRIWSRNPDRAAALREELQAIYGDKLAQGYATFRVRFRVGEPASG